MSAAPVQPITPENDALIGPRHPDEKRPDWGEIFGARRPLHCEIGSGRGHFAIDFAASHEVNFVAIEVRRSDCENIRARRAKRGLKNLEVFQGDARLLVPRFFSPGQLDAIHIHCPDPWWKKRHHRRRLVADDFVLELYGLLRVGGELDIRTDVPAYAEAIRESCEEIIGFENVHGPGVERPLEESLVLSTRERRYRETGRPVHRFQYRRPDRPPLSEDTSSSRARRSWVDVRQR